MFDILKILISDSVYAMIMPGIFLGILLLIVGSYIPTIFSQYKLPAQLSGVVLVLFFVFQAGRYHEHVAVKEQTLVNEVATQAFNAAAGEVKYKTVVEYKDKIKVVEKIKEIPIHIYVPGPADKSCKIDELAPNLRKLIDSAAEGVPL